MAVSTCDSVTRSRKMIGETFGESCEVGGKNASTGIDLLLRLSNIDLISGDPSVQSASIGTIFCSCKAFFTFGVSIAKLRLYLQVRHQSAEKSTITVSPCSRSWESLCSENGSHLISESTGPRNANAAVPSVPEITAACVHWITPAMPRFFWVRPTHQHPAQIATRSAKVGTK